MFLYCKKFISGKINCLRVVYENFNCTNSFSKNVVTTFRSTKNYLRTIQILQGSCQEYLSRTWSRVRNRGLGEGGQICSVPPHEYYNSIFTRTCFKSYLIILNSIRSNVYLNRNR